MEESGNSSIDDQARGQQAESQHLGNSKRKGKERLAVVLIIGIIVIAVVMVIYHASPSVRLSRQISLGNSYLEEQEYQEATAAFKSALAIEPSSEKAKEQLGNAYQSWSNSDMAAGNYETAIKTLQAAKTDLPDRDFSDQVIEVYTSWTQSYIDAGDYDTALKTLQRAQTDLPDQDFSEQMINIYSEWTQHYLDQDDTDNAKKILDEGTATLGYKPPAFNELYSRIEERVKEKQVEQIDLGENDDTSLAEKERFYTALDKIVVAVNTANDDDLDSIYSLIGSDDFQALINKMTDLNYEDNLIVETPDGMIGIYHVETNHYGNYMIYCGDYKGRTREGNGTWIGSKGGQHYYATGEWKDDKPNGQQSIQEWNEDLSEDVVVREINGDVVNGLWNGEVSWGFRIDEGEMAWKMSFDNGHVISAGTDDDGYMIWSEKPYINTTKSYAAELYFEGSDGDNTFGILPYGVDD